MNPLQESKQELNAAIRYAENAISSAKQTMESMNTYQEQTGREQALEAEVAELRDIIDRMSDDATGSSVTIKLLNEENANLKAEVNALEQPEQPTMPVIPKAVAIAIFREGVQHGVEAACTELDEAQFIRIEESEYVGDVYVTFERDLDLNDHIDTDWMRGKCGDYSEERVIDALGTLCADNEFECRIHGVDDNNNEQNSTT